MAGPATRDLALYRGDDYAHQITFVDAQTHPEPIPVDDYTFKAEIRDRPENGTVVYATFSIDTSQASEGIIVLHLTASQTRIPSGYWDLQATISGSRKTWLKGEVIMDGDVTQEATP